MFICFLISRPSSSNKDHLSINFKASSNSDCFGYFGGLSCASISSSSSSSLSSLSTIFTISSSLNSFDLLMNTSKSISTNSSAFKMSLSTSFFQLAYAVKRFKWVISITEARVLCFFWDACLLKAVFDGVFWNSVPWFDQDLHPFKNVNFRDLFTAINFIWRFTRFDRYMPSTLGLHLDAWASS